MATKERIELIEWQMRREYGRDDIKVLKADARCGNRYGIAAVKGGCIRFHLSEYLPLKELEAYVIGLLSADNNKILCQQAQ